MPAALAQRSQSRWNTEPVGISPGALVWVLRDTGSVSPGAYLLGRVIDGRDDPLDGQAKQVGDTRFSLYSPPINFNGAQDRQQREHHSGQCAAGQQAADRKQAF